MENLNKSPFVSIIIPIRNEATYIERSLNAVLSQDYPLEMMEIIVVDGMSTDNTKEIISKIKDRVSKIKIFILDNPLLITSKALNIGLVQCKGDVVIRIDGHCEIAPDYVKKCLEVLEKTGADCVGGLQYAIGENFVSNVIAYAMRAPFGVGNSRFHYAKKPGWVDTVYLGAYPKDVFKRIGAFDEELVRSQDSEFNLRLIQAEGKIWLDPSIRSRYYNRQTLRSLWSQYFNYGIYKMRVIQKRKSFRCRQVVPPLFVLAFTISLIASIFMKKASLVLTVIIPYAVANILVSLWYTKKKPYLMPILSIVFFIMHYAWGLGFIYGLWKWGNLWLTKKQSLG
jgi:glycosyltransferase involved in cell wall biosynthesis